ncbi:hypothetical protein [Methylovulum psychrotolerans]|uniref:hypothetical protein n=1 Tax=Methylovulum psychrotolerans TaxID=1704499 RepID=UPI0012FB5B08|nr:hypothetical protein [Methylovulum psychrotolerans]
MSEKIFRKREVSERLLPCGCGGVAMQPGGKAVKVQRTLQCKSKAVAVAIPWWFSPITGAIYYNHRNDKGEKHQY